ncbi:hypothetical protein BO70DRAFT_35204 [Aspergillus heteromorphus CBS 117.55]|uniref:Uncharacterized protein n=1 Tax=Aspergillus heteromorphus CBS 117.55 TaxID=1448321 RepID=A0A317W846_9EURO|nr:uncharacterized protein BO70DRAFT_35204 [Aspergillus heteromorphus CBS 117.55]PWY82085.1 hypothetical protein BO70DRAFT_35204 [Aspergillus heteromorphus CBS 117.55]
MACSDDGVLQFSCRQPQPSFAARKPGTPSQALSRHAECSPRSDPARTQSSLLASDSGNVIEIREPWACLTCAPIQFQRAVPDSQTPSPGLPGPRWAPEGSTTRQSRCRGPTRARPPSPPPFPDEGRGTRGSASPLGTTHHRPFPSIPALLTGPSASAGPPDQEARRASIMAGGRCHAPAAHAACTRLSTGRLSWIFFPC